MSLLQSFIQGRFPADRAEFFAKHIRPNGRPWSYEGHEYLRAIVADDARDIVIRKAAQLGVSTVAIGRLLHDCCMGRKVGYYLTDRDFMTAFVQDKVDPLINADEDLARATTEGKAAEGEPTARAKRKSADNLRIKHIGQGSAWFQGLQSRKDAKSIDLDSLVKDELDELDPEFVPWLDDRLLHSQYKRSFSLSQPGVPEYGIDADFQASDRKFWLIRCNRCRRWCNLIDDYPDCLVRHGADDWRIVCKRCGARVTPVADHRTEWVAECPGVPVSGYALSQLYGPHCDAAEVARRQAKAEKSSAALYSLMVSIVGRPHAGDRQPLNDSVLAAASGDWPIGPVSVLDAGNAKCGDAQPLRVAGIDTGDVLHAVIAQRCRDGVFRVFDIRLFDGGDQWEKLAAWLIMHDCHFFVVDAQPYATNSKNLCRTPGLNGAVCYFNAASLAVDVLEKESAHPIKAVKHDRTEAIDEMADAVIAREIMLPQARLDVSTTVKRHCKNLVKDLGSDGKFRYKRAVENHYGLALTYLQLARRVCEILRIGPGLPLGDVSNLISGDPLAVTRW